MATEMEVEIIKKEAIKPSSPTPNHKKNFKLSLIDQHSPPIYGSVVLFYSKNARRSSGGNQQYLTVPERSELLKWSLSETLTRFYLFAGRIKDESLIECNDDGALFVQAQVNCILSKFLQNPDAKLVRKLIPAEAQLPGDCVLLIQATFFSCGGMAIGICLSHKIADAASLFTFSKSWAARAAGSGEASVIPLFNAASIFPPQNLSFTKGELKFDQENTVAVRFVFNASKINELKAKVASEAVQRPTRVEAVTALIWKCAMKAAAASRSNSSPDSRKVSVLSQSANLRKRLVPPLPEQTIGNLAFGRKATNVHGHQIELKDLAALLRKGMQDYGANYVKKLQEDEPIRAVSESYKETGELLQQGKVDFFLTSSVCRFPFYDVDFGWGKPTWFTSPIGIYKNSAIMMDTVDGKGIEAWVALTETDMALFEHDQELLAFASLNPNVNVLMKNAENPMIIRPKSSL